MPTAVTQDIRISVSSRYDPVRSDPRAGRFLFAYRIAITNLGNDPVRLLRRHWHIVDSLAPANEVEGAGVVGETPVIDAGATFTYASACELHSGLGRMRGTYLMLRVRDGHRFTVHVPEFLLVHPPQLN